MVTTSWKTIQAIFTNVGNLSSQGHLDVPLVLGDERTREVDLDDGDVGQKPLIADFKFTWLWCPIHKTLNH